MISALKKVLFRTLRRHPTLVFPIVFLLNHAVGANDRKFVVRSFSLNQYDRRLDWQARGISVASDGSCYFACSSHANNRGSALFRYDPSTGTLKLICEDITAVCGEDPTRTPPQGKIRSDLVEANGWLYFGTHLANYWLEAERSYTGGHVVGYHLATGQFRDYGVVHRNLTVYSGVAVDPRRSWLYVYVTPYPHGESTHLYRIHLKSGTKQDLGVVHPGEGVSHFLFVDRDGNCWFASTGAGGTLFCARGANGRLDRWPDMLPRAYSWQNASEKQKDDGRCMRWGQSLPDSDGHHCLLTMEASTGDSGDVLWFLDTSRTLPDAFRPLARIGLTELGLTVNSGSTYFIQQGYAKPLERVRSKPIQRIIARIASALMMIGAYPGLHLWAMRLDGRSLTDLGLIVDQDGRKPTRIESLAVDKASIYTVGDWRLLPEEKGTLMFHHHRKAFESLSTGQFFAFAQVD